MAVKFEKITLMSKHTQGPWMIYDDGDDEHSSDIINVWIDNRDGGDNYDIAAMLLDRPVGERKANARLISSAPDLLEALEEIVERFSKCGAGGGADDCRCYEDNQRVAEQAVAKARGE
jgi:hypothetical protein